MAAAPIQTIGITFEEGMCVLRGGDEYESGYFHEERVTAGTAMRWTR